MKAGFAIFLAVQFFLPKSTPFSNNQSRGGRYFRPAPPDARHFWGLFLGSVIALNLAGAR